VPVVATGVAALGAFTGLHYFGAWGALAGAMLYPATMLVWMAVVSYQETPRMSRAVRRYVREMRATETRE
jgi:hypothetical protein